ncbi:MAG TPA: DUF4388 domain-containing protein [Candidatus Polarisedimenticolia bacterium]|nr:DUF4388 domain-containing protein [Candidatus Polarisedimenticolia bacterium]
MALKGTLRDFSLADIFQLIGIQRKTGVLTLKSQQEVVTVSFVDGNVVAADTLHRRLEDRLGTLLVKSGRISETQLQEALKIQKNTLKRMGDILVESNFIDAGALQEALQIQISQMVYRLFRWRDGEYNFSQEERVEYDAERVTPMSAESILMEGARILDEWPMIEKGIRSFSTVFKRANVEIASGSGARGGDAGAGDEGARAVTLSDQERSIYNLVDGKRTVQEVVERSTLSEFDTCRILYELLGRQIIEEGRPAVIKGAPAPVEAPPARGPSPVLLGLGYLILILLAGGVLLVRARPAVLALRTEPLVGATLRPLIGSEAVGSMQESVSRGRLQRVDFAVQVYYLLSRGYPSELGYLVTSHLLRQNGIVDATNQPFTYDVLPGGYRLSLAGAQTTTGSSQDNSTQATTQSQ